MPADVDDGHADRLTHLRRRDPNTSGVSAHGFDQILRQRHSEGQVHGIAPLLEDGIGKGQDTPDQ
jgi:hypothetical protein